MSIERVDQRFMVVSDFIREPFFRKPFSVPCGGLLKRIFDIAFATTALVALSPLLLGLALMVRLTDRGPILFSHMRVGHNGKLFPCLKFRSMAHDSDAIFAQHLAESVDARKEWEVYGKLRNDPRITPIGHYLRKYSLDELPQLINILRGEMSVVGPRPVAIAELQNYGRSTRHYLKCRPGLTGLWQVSGRSNLSYRKRVALDRAYVQNWSLPIDIALIFRTFSVVLKGDGSY